MINNFRSAGVVAGLFVLAPVWAANEKPPFVPVTLDTKSKHKPKVLQFYKPATTKTKSSSSRSKGSQVSSAPIITSVSAPALVLRAGGGAGKLRVTGRNLLSLSQARVVRNKRSVADCQAKLSGRSASNREVRVKCSAKVAPGNYGIQLLAGKSWLAVPTKLTVSAKKMTRVTQREKDPAKMKPLRLDRTDLSDRLAAQSSVSMSLRTSSQDKLSQFRKDGRNPATRSKQSSDIGRKIGNQVGRKGVGRGDLKTSSANITADLGAVLGRRAGEPTSAEALFKQQRAAGTPQGTGAQAFLQNSALGKNAAPRGNSSSVGVSGAPKPGKRTMRDFSDSKKFTLDRGRVSTEGDNNSSGPKHTITKVEVGPDEKLDRYHVNAPNITFDEADDILDLDGTPEETYAGGTFFRDKAD